MLKPSLLPPPNGVFTSTVLEDYGRDRKLKCLQEPGGHINGSESARYKKKSTARNIIKWNLY